MMGKEGITIVVLDRKGRLHLALAGAAMHALPAEEVRRWVDEGYETFVIASDGKQWAANHANSGRMMTSGDAHQNAHATVDGGEAMRLLDLKGGKP